MSTRNYSPAILDDPDFVVFPLSGRPTNSSFLIRVNTTLSLPDSLSDSEDSEEDDLYTAKFSGDFSLPLNALADVAAARKTVSDMLSAAYVPPSLGLRSTVVQKILETLVHAGRGADVSVNVYVDQLPDDDDDDDDDDDVIVGFVPASKETILGLKREKIRESTMTCPVCLEDFQIGSEVIRLPCKHCYHEDCIVEWLSKNKLCPTCRFELP